MSIKLQPVIPELDYAEKDSPVMAAEAWMDGPTKPRHAKRKNEKPKYDVSLENISDVFPFVEVGKPIYVRNAHDLKKHDLTDVDAFIIDPGDPNAFPMSSVMIELFRSKKPVLPSWDNWGYAWRGKLTTGWAKALDEYSFSPMGYEDVKNLMYAIRGIKKMRSLNILYIGAVPSHSVNADVNVIRIYEKFGCSVTPIPFQEYEQAVQNAGAKEVKKLSEEWLDKFKMLDDREQLIDKYSAIKVGLDDLLEKYQANALTVDCAYLPSVELVPCVAASLFLDKGIPYGCEGDTNQLITSAMFMGTSDNPSLMGNLFENALHSDIEDNRIVINHDILPPSMVSDKCQICFRDFHEVKKGSTLYGDLKEEQVTIGGMNFDSSEMWLSKGKVDWTEDTAHCRVSIGFEVEDAKRIAREALGHHQVTIYGDYIKSLKLLANFIGLDVKEL